MFRTYSDNTKNLLKLKDTMIPCLKCQCKCGEWPYSVYYHHKYSCHRGETGSLIWDEVHSK